MSQMIQKGLFNQGRNEGKIEDIVRLLRIRFNQISDEIVDELNSRTDLVALDSLFDLAVQCDTFNEFCRCLEVTLL